MTFSALSMPGVAKALVLARRGAFAPKKIVEGASASTPVSNRVAQRGDARLHGGNRFCLLHGRAEARNARQIFRSRPAPPLLPPPPKSGVNTASVRMTSAPTPCGPPSLCAEMNRSAPASAAISPRPGGLNRIDMDQRARLVLRDE